MSSLPKRRYTLDEYFELELNSEARYEYWNGEIIDMSGAAPNHEQVITNFIRDIGTQLRGRPCRMYSSNLRVKTPAAPPYRYPDITVICGKPEFQEIGGINALTNPTLLVEVLSPATEGYDRGDKFTAYKSIPSFREYLLISARRPHVARFVRQADGTWNQDEANDLEAELSLSSIDCTLRLRDLYADVEFSNPPLFALLQDPI